MRAHVFLFVVLGSQWASGCGGCGGGNNQPDARSPDAPRVDAAIDACVGPLVVFVNPSTVSNTVNTPVAVFTTGVTLPVTGVSITLAGSGNPATSLSFTTSSGHPERPNAIVPAATPAGTYDVIVTDSGGCPAVLPAGLHVTNTTTLTLTGILPSFGWTGETTAVAIGASTPPGFGPLPVAYLTNTALVTPIILGSAARISATSLTGEVPMGLTPGLYDLIVVNVDGTVGVLPSAFTVTANPPPKVNSIAPSQVPNTSATQAITINGANFRAAALGNPQVVLRCVNPNAVALADQTATVSAFTATTISATFNATTYTVGANCVVVVTNTDDGSRTEFSSLVVVTPTQNLTGFTAGPPMITARRGLAAASGAAGLQSRFVYAIAGDNGTAALATIETLPVDIFGLPGQAFFTQRSMLGTARTGVAAARIGRFIYAIGGTSTMGSATGALDTIERAAILDQSFHPDNLSVDLALSATDGLSGGIYYYRVAAVMPANDPFNPSGETLPSPAFGVNLPTLTGQLLRVTLSWSAVPNAVGYRIYRTAAGNAPGTETLIADTTGTLPAKVTCASAIACTDLGATPDATNAPLPLGSTGTWTTLTTTMGAKRWAPGVTVAIDPTDATRAYIYVFGGRNAAGTVLASYEFLGIQLNGDASQTVLGRTAGTLAMGAARYRLGAYVATPADSPLLGTNTYVWAGGGANAADAMVTTFDGGRVTAGGQLAVAAGTTLASVGPMNPQAAGYGAFGAGGFLYAFGGQNGVPDINNMSAAHTNTPPALQNFQGFSPGLATARVDVGAAEQSGYFYVIGGAVTGGTPTTSIEYVLY